MAPPPIAVSPRTRWAARSMVLKEWLLPPDNNFHSNQPICDLEIDGESLTFTSESPPMDFGSAMWRYVAPGNEVGPWGLLLEYSMNASRGRDRLHPSARRRLERRDRYPRVFINYRRDDAEAYAGRLHEALVRAVGRDEVFMDVFSVHTGEPFTWTIQQAVTHADVVISLIGPRWLTIADSQGRPRIDSHRDFVRREISAAWDRGTTILPVLLPNASLPTADALPEELQGVLDLQFLDLTARHWDADVTELTAEVERRLTTEGTTAR